MASYNALYNQVGGNFARANARMLNGDYEGKAISAFSLHVVDATESAQYTFLRHSNRAYPPIRFDYRQMALIPFLPEARTEFINWFFRSLSAGKRKPTPEVSVPHAAPLRRHANLCANIEARYCQAPPAKKKRRLVGMVDSSDEEEEAEPGTDIDSEMDDFIVPDDFVEYEN